MVADEALGRIVKLSLQGFRALGLAFWGLRFRGLGFRASMSMYPFMKYAAAR